MKPIAVFQHTEVGAPGAVVPILEALGREVVLVRIVDGDAVPADASGFGGLVFMGGSMGARDPLPWIAQELALIRDADARGIPVAGHCLGSHSSRWRWAAMFIGTTALKSAGVRSTPKIPTRRANGWVNTQGRCCKHSSGTATPSSRQRVRCDSRAADTAPIRLSRCAGCTCCCSRTWR